MFSAHANSQAQRTASRSWVIVTFIAVLIATAVYPLLGAIAALIVALAARTFGRPARIALAAIGVIALLWWTLITPGDLPFL